MRIFIDANIIISSLLFPKGKVAFVFSYILKKHTIIISSYTKQECIEVFKNKFIKKIDQLYIFFDKCKYELITKNIDF